MVPAVARPSPSAGELFATYRLDPNVDLRYLPVGRGNDRYDARVMLRLLTRHAQRAARRGEEAVVISDDVRFMLPYLVAARLWVRRLITAPWLHGVRGRRLERFTCAKATCVLATNEAILRDLASHGVRNQRTFVTGNPVPLERLEFGRSYTKAEARRRLGLDPERPVISYTGKLFLGMKELEYLLTAAARLSECLFLFTGGQPPVIEWLEADLRARGTTNVLLAGMLENPEETRYYQKAADVLVTYYSTEDHPYAHHQLPGKLAEYMATGNPIVAADFPAVRDLLHSGNAVLTPPHDVDALAEALQFALRPEAAALGARAQQEIAAMSSESVAAELGRFLAAEGVER